MFTKFSQWESVKEKNIREASLGPIYHGKAQSSFQSFKDGHSPRYYLVGVALQHLKLKFGMSRRPYRGDLMLCDDVVFVFEKLSFSRKHGFIVAGQCFDNTLYVCKINEINSVMEI